MKKFAIIFLVCALAVIPASALSWNKLPAQVQGARTFTYTDRLPGVDLADGISKITGTAVSPLLGVSAVGAWSYFNAPESQRENLPWFSRPYIWGIGFLLLSACFLKDVGGAFIPFFIKKPLDAADIFQNKICAALACVGFVPFVATEIAHASSGGIAAVEENIKMASMLAGNEIDLRFMMVPAAMIGFTVVWLACHAINVLILLSPFRFIDGILKAFKLLLVSAIAVSSSIAPWLGMVISLLLVYVAWLLAPWAFRLAVFGTIFSLDVFFPWHGRRSARSDEPRAFLAKNLNEVPVRTYGRLERAKDGISFKYRPWLVLSERSVMLSTNGTAIAKGVLYPSLECADEDRQRRTVLIFRPCHRSHVHAIASNFEIAEVRESPVVRGFRAVRRWLTDTISLNRRNVASDIRGPGGGAGVT